MLEVSVESWQSNDWEQAIPVVILPLQQLCTFELGIAVGLSSRRHPSSPEHEGIESPWSVVHIVQGYLF